MIAAIGIAPTHTTTRVNHGVVRRHAEEAAFLWGRRRQAAWSMRYRLADLADLDRRLEAHLQGLLLAPDAARQACHQVLLEGEPLAWFPLAVLALDMGQTSGWDSLIAQLPTHPSAEAALVDALAWQPPARAQPALQRLMHAPSARHQRLALMAATAARRAPPAPLLAQALNSPDAALRCEALRAVGLLHEGGFVGLLLEHLDEPDPSLALAAACSLAQLGRREGATHLEQAVLRGGPGRGQALALWVRGAGLVDGRRIVSGLSQQPGAARDAVIGTALVGDIASVPWLIARMASPELARVAGASFSTITGADLARLDLDTTPPQDLALDDAEPLAESDAALMWPDPAKVQAWWHAQPGRLPADCRCLAGQAITEGSLLQILAAERQPLRHAAALELAMLRTPHGYPQVLARGDWQQRWWTT